MNKKIFKISFILILAFVFCGSYVYATNIDLNLPGITSENNEQMTNNVETVNNEQTANNVENSIENISNTVDNVVDNSITTPSTPAETLQPSGVSTSAETELGITNIINILLITVGVILILLAIAILIRLRG